MNERINQLLSQAYDEAVPETWTTLSSEQLGRVYNKFAELIVADCIDVADKCREDEWFDVSGAIAEHFGVER